MIEAVRGPDRAWTGPGLGPPGCGARAADGGDGCVSPVPVPAPPTASGRSVGYFAPTNCMW